MITHTIERWDGKEAARRIELHVGRDLQFIRINGTIVGGLVGVRSTPSACCCESADLATSVHGLRLSGAGDGSSCT